MVAINYQALLVKYMTHMRDRDPTSWLPSDDDPGFTRDDIDELDRLAEPLVVDLRATGPDRATATTGAHRRC